MNCLSINIQEAGSRDKRVWIRSLCNKHKVIFLAIQESKLENLDLLMVHSFGGNAFFCHVFTLSRKVLGGIIAIGIHIISLILMRPKVRELFGCKFFRYSIIFLVKSLFWEI